MSTAIPFPIRIVLVDDHERIRSALRRFFGLVEDIVVVDEASNGEEALELVKTLHPDVLLLDVEMPGANGYEVACKVSELDADVRILAVTSHYSLAIVERMMAHGAAGYITKGEIVEFLFAAIYFLVTHRNDYWLSPEVKRRLQHRIKFLPPQKYARLLELL